MKKIFKIIGLMSGTSCDGIDAGMVETDGENFIKLGPSHYKPYSCELKKELIKLTKDNNFKQKEIEDTLTNLHANAVDELLTMTRTDSSEIDYLGFHGHTIDHKPEQGITKQIGNIKKLAQITRIKTVGDFRSNDVKNGGQGAPIVPIFLKGLNVDKSGVFLNIGGVANLTLISKNHLIAFDTGPGNAVINDMVEEHFSLPYDENGKLASKGVVDKDAIERWLSNEYFLRKYPKSLDRNTFLYLKGDIDNSLKPEDKIATLAEFTAQTVCLGLKNLPFKVSTIYVYGGGRKNNYIMRRISEISGIQVFDINEMGFDGDFIEAYAFAYLAARSIKNLPITFQNTTGVKNPLTGGNLEII